MSLRFRRSKQIAPGVRLNVGSKSVGVSAGKRGLHVGYNSRTGAYVSVGLPGTGIYYRKSLGKLTLPSVAPAGFNTPSAPAIRPPSSQAATSSNPASGSSGVTLPPNPLTVPMTVTSTASYGCVGLGVAAVVLGLSPLLAIMATVVFGASLLRAELFLIAVGIACGFVGFSQGRNINGTTATARANEAAINRAARAAWQALHQGRPQNAVAHLEFLQRATPDNTNVPLLLSVALLDVDPERGRDLMLNCLRRGGAGAQKDSAFGVLGQHFFGLGDFANAERAFAKALELSTTQEARDDANLLRAAAVLRTGEPKRALEILCLLKPHLPGNEDLVARAHLIRGACFEELGKERAAHSEWQKAAAINPNLVNEVERWLKTHQNGH